MVCQLSAIYVREPAAEIGPLALSLKLMKRGARRRVCMRYVQVTDSKDESTAPRASKEARWASVKPLAQVMLVPS